ncbi:MAG TPA: hypothetical protein VKG64_17670 [Methylomirabilota bacterium]|jgi:hypothetical protein|nr:hypothetical protein [Methylomirabilota bacterium]
MAKGNRAAVRPTRGSPEGVLADYFREEHPGIYRKVQLQVRRTPRRQTGKWKTNRACRWTLDPKHPDYTAADQICRIEAKLFATTLEFDAAPKLGKDIADAARAVLGHEAVTGAYRCPVSGRRMNFEELEDAADNPTHGRSAFQVGHVRPKGKGGVNTPENVYWNTDLGNRIQGDKTLADTIKTIIEMAEFQRQKENIEWGELVNRYLD